MWEKFIKFLFLAAEGETWKGVSGVPWRFRNPKLNNKVPRCVLFIKCYDFDASLIVRRPRG